MKQKPTYQELEKQIAELKKKNKASQLHYPQSYEGVTDYYITILNNIGDPVFVKDNESKLLIVNDAFCKAFNLSRENIIGKTLAEDVPPDERESFLRIDNQVLEDGVENINEESLTVRDGQTRTISTRKTRFIDTEGNKFLIGIIRDITERKEMEEALRESERRIRTILETEPECVKILDLNGKLEYMNPAGLNMIDAENLDQVKGQSMLPLVTEPFRRSFANLITKTLNGDGGKLKFQAIGLKGRPIWLETNSVPLRHNNEKIIGVLGLTRDITDRKKADDALKESEKQLKELNDTKDKLFSIIAHDLRSPFNNIIGFSQLLFENLDTNEIAESRRYTEIINSTAKKTLILLDNLLNWAKSQTGELSINPEKVRLSEVILEIIGLNRSFAKAKEISFHYSPKNEIELYTDENILKTVLRNLISNAIKFTILGGNITLVASTNKNMVEISISDNGVGMSKEKIHKLFSLSTNAVSRGTANEKGSGLGLVLCKEFVEKLGGSIWVESEIGKGSDFKFTLPLNKPE